MFRSPALRLSIACLFVLFISIISAHSQDFRATITGRVADSTNAAVPNAPVTVKNTGTNETLTITTSADGYYKAPFLRPGTYTVTVETTGFKKAIVSDITLVISQAATINVTLEAGNISEQVTIQGEENQIETANADRGGVIDRQKVLELPLNARNPFMLGQLTAGVTFNGASIWQRPFDNGAIAEWSINGSQARGNEFLLDGAPNNSQAGGNNIAYVPPVDAVQEFKIMTNTYDAQYGKTTGGIINVSLKSGTNSFHGSLYEFLRRESLDATDFRDNAYGRPKSSHYLDQYGGLIDGPVWIPKIYNGKDKTFFMFNYEGYREGIPSPLILSVPTPEMFNGDFSKLVDKTGKLIPIYDPRTARSVTDATICGKNDNGTPKTCIIRDQFPGNKIPQNRLNPIAQKLLGFQPKPNYSDPNKGYSEGNFISSPNLATDSFYNWVFKVDQQFNEKHRMYVRYAHNDRTEDRNNNGITSTFGQDGQHPLKRINNAFVVDHLATFSPTFIFNIRTSFGRYIEGSRGDANIGFDQTTLGFPAGLISQLPNTKAFGRYEFSGYNSLGRYTGFNYSNTVATHPTVTLLKGNQTWKAGIDMRWTQYITKNDGNPFRLTANGDFTREKWNEGTSSGNSLATFLLGYVSGGGIDYNVFPTTLTKYYSPWLQNDWKVNRKFTLNLGLRWDFNGAPNERYNRINHGFDAAAINPVDKLIDRTKFPNIPQLKGGLLFAGVNGQPETVSPLDKNNIQPRVGFAYSLTEKLVMRGGWGLFYVNPSNDYLQYNGFNQFTELVNSLDGGITPIENLLSNPFPNGVSSPTGNSKGLETFLGRGFSYFNSNFVVPKVHQYSFGFQYQMPWDARLEISYVGNRTLGLQTNRPLNEPNLEFRKKCNALEGGTADYCNGKVTNPFKGIEAFKGSNLYAANEISRWDLARPLPHFGAITEVGRNDGEITYDSLQVTFDKRTRSGLGLNMTYTFSKHIEQWGFNDVQQNSMQRGLYITDRPHVFKTGMVYQLPFGDGKPFLNTSNKFLKKIVSGWQTSLIMFWQSGRPWGMGDNVQWINPNAVINDVQWKGVQQAFGFRTYQTASGVQGVCVGRYSNSTGKLEVTPKSKDLIGCTVDKIDVIKKPDYAPRAGSYRHPSIRMHSPMIADLSFSKTTKLTEKIGMQFRVEMFNFTNTFNYNAQHFNTDLESLDFGSIRLRDASNTGVAYPRHIQLGMKLNW